MPKSLNPDQIAMLDKEVSKLDKKLDNKDMEKAMGMLMKKVGIKESDLDELSLSMKSITKSGIGKTGVDKDKLKMGLKDLRKKLDKDKKKDEAHIVRSKKGLASIRRKSADENPKIRKEEELDEIGPAIAWAAGHAANAYRMTKPIVDPIIKKGIDKAVPVITKTVDKIKNRFGGKGKGSGSSGRLSDRGPKPDNIAPPKNTKPPTQRSNLPNRAGATPGAPDGKKKGLGLGTKIALGVGGAYAAKKTYNAVRNKARENEAERKRKSAEYQQRRQNDA